MKTETTGQATYCPEDNKLRLYIGRVPREEYLALRDAGWKALHKQREAGGGDFVAIWTPERYETAMRYSGGIVEDEDMGPAERAADRAERFAGYREKRIDDASGHADRYESGPQVHGYQSEAKAERAAARHDRIGDKAGDAWSKAEYWQQRTAGVIGHALHLSDASTRMGRIKELELAIARHERNERDDAWTNHYRLRLAYENQMLEACGGRAAVVEMVVGGFYKGERIHGINKSPVTGNVVSVEVFGSYRTYRKGDLVTAQGVYRQNIERDGAASYRAPTAEEMAEFEAAQKAEKKAKREAKKLAPPAPQLINPTDADAERLQALINANPRFHGDKPATVVRMTQEQFSARIGGSCDTEMICETGLPHKRVCGEQITRSDVYKVRLAHGAHYQVKRVVILTDKPQKEIPWAAVEAARATHPTAETMRPKMAELQPEVAAGFRHCYSQLLQDARYVGWVRIQSLSQVSWSESGAAEWAKFKAAQSVTV